MTRPVENDNTPVLVGSDVNERASFLERILESAILCAIVTEDLGGVILTWNDGAKRMYGYTAEEMIRSQSSRILYSEEDVASGRTDSLFSAAQQTGAAEGVFEHVKKDGQRLTAYVGLMLLRDGKGVPVGLLSISKDITERAKYYQQLRHNSEELEERYRRVEQTNRLTSEFLGDVVHELRTPLNSIIGFAELLLDGKTGPMIASQHEFLGDILSSARHLLQLINDTFDLIQVESAFMEFCPQPVDLTAVGIEVCRSLESLAARKHIDIKLEVDPSLSEIEIDPAKLKQVLRNLLSTVLKFTTEAGEVLLRIKSDGTDRFIVEIEGTDAGSGNDDIRRLFQAVEQPRALNVHKQQSTALSLAVAKRIVEAQGGEMRIRTTSGQGSILWVRLPRKFDHAEHGEPNVESALPIEGAPVVLIIDPNARDRASLVEFLSQENYQPIPAATGAEALEYISKITFAVITVDILLPDASELLKTIRKSVLNRNTPVLAVATSDREPNVEYRAYDWLVKPVGREQLLQAVRDAQSDAAKVRILVVDDDPSSLKLARHALTGEGYRVICASEGEEALRLVETDGPAAIVLDMVRNGIDGFEFLRRLRRKSGERIPVIIWSGKSFTPDERDRLLRNVNKVVQKGDGGTKEIIEELKAALLGSASPRR